MAPRCHIIISAWGFRPRLGIRWWLNRHQLARRQAYVLDQLEQTMTFKVCLDKDETTCKPWRGRGLPGPVRRASAGPLCRMDITQQGELDTATVCLSALARAGILVRRPA